MLMGGCSGEDLVEKALRDNQIWAARERKAQLEARVEAEKNIWLRERTALREREDRIAAEKERSLREAEATSVLAAQVAARRVAELANREEARQEDLRYFALKEMPGLWQELKALRERIGVLDERLSGLKGADATRQEKAITGWNRLKRAAQGTEVALERAFKADWLYQNQGGLEQYAAAKKKELGVAESAVRVPGGAGANDTRASQLKIAQMLAANDSKALREKARLVLVDEEAILSLICSPRGSGADLAEWAVGLKLPQKALEVAVGSAATQEAAFSLLARLASPQSLEQIARGYLPAAVRAAAVSRLGAGSERALMGLARDKNAGVRELALVALERTAPEAALAIRAKFAAAARAEEEQRQIALQERDAQDKLDCKLAEDASRTRLDHELQSLWQDLLVQADIRTCRDWGRLQKSGTRVKKRTVCFSGTVDKVKKHWFSKDELWVNVECRGAHYQVYAQVPSAKGIDEKKHVWVKGIFIEADSSEVKLKKAVVTLK